MCTPTGNPSIHPYTVHRTDSTGQDRNKPDLLWYILYYKAQSSQIKSIQHTFHRESSQHSCGPRQALIDKCPQLYSIRINTSIIIPPLGCMACMMLVCPDTCTQHMYPTHVPTTTSQPTRGLDWDNINSLDISFGIDQAPQTAPDFLHYYDQLLSKLSILELSQTVGTP